VLLRGLNHNSTASQAWTVFLCPAVPASTANSADDPTHPPQRPKPGWMGPPLPEVLSAPTETRSARLAVLGVIATCADFALEGALYAESANSRTNRGWDDVPAAVSTALPNYCTVLLATRGRAAVEVLLQRFQRRRMQEVTGSGDVSSWALSPTLLEALGTPARSSRVAVRTIKSLPPKRNCPTIFCSR
jgi:hypothetical protein